MAYRTRSRSSRGRSSYGGSRGRRTVSRRHSPARAGRRTARASGRTIRLVIEQQPLQTMARPDGAFQVAMAAPRKAVF